jgi:hypothetical protein
MLITVTGAVLGMLVVAPSARPDTSCGDGDAALASLAKIVLHFTHVPSVTQTERLHGLLNDPATTGPERVLAEAVLHMEHLVSRDDRAALDALIRDASVPAAVKTLATILTHMTHTPTEADKETLRQLCARSCAGAGCLRGLSDREVPPSKAQEQDQLWTFASILFVSGLSPRCKSLITARRRVRQRRRFAPTASDNTQFC